MDFPGRTLRAVCDISTGTLNVTQRPPVYTRETGALAVEVELRKNGTVYAPSASVSAGMYLFWPGSPYMTDLITMTISANVLRGTFSDVMTAKAGRPLLVIQLQDTGTGDLIVAAAEPILIANVEGDIVVTTRPPTPAEVVYIGRSPYIDMTTLHWMEWDVNSHMYVDTGVLSKGGGVETVNGISPDPSGNVEITKSDVGLGNVDNTSDADKPISTAAQTALDGKVPTTRKVNGHALSADVDITKTDVGLGNVDNTSDANKPISTAAQTALDGKVPITRTVNGHALSRNIEITKTDVGLGNVDNTSDANKPISTAAQTALDGKVPITRTVNGHALSRNIEITKTDVGLGNVDNTSDANKPISTAAQTALDGKVPKSRKINNKELSTDVTLVGTDIEVSSSDNTKLDSALSSLNDHITNLKNALTSGSQADAIYHLGFYLDANGDLCQVDS
jgi:hypothetical protein